MDLNFFFLTFNTFGVLKGSYKKFQPIWFSRLNNNLYLFLSINQKLLIYLKTNGKFFIINFLQIKLNIFIFVCWIF